MPAFGWAPVIIHDDVTYKSNVARVSDGVIARTLEQSKTGVWKNRKPESGIGTEMGTGTGTGTGNSNGTETAI